MKTHRDERLDSLIEEYLSQVDSGQVPDENVLLDRAGDMADALRRWIHAHKAVSSVAEELAGWETEDDFHDGRPGVLPHGKPDSRFNDFQDLVEIGSGGLATVYRAFDARLERTVALKVLKAERLPAKEVWLKEARALARIDHPNVVKVFDAGIWDGKPYLVMEHIEGAALDLILKALSGEETNGDPALATAVEVLHPRRARLKFAIRLAKALEACHARGILHRDIKPRNILVTRDGKPHLVDFGLAHQSTDRESTQVTKSLWGTPPYLAPEQIESERTGEDERSDLYSLGTVLYELFALKHPFAETGRKSLFDAILATPPPPIPGALAEINDVLAVCLRKHPDDRYASVHDLAEDLYRVSALIPIHGRPLGWCRKMMLWGRRRRKSLAVTSLLVLTGILAPLSYSLGNYLLEKRGFLNYLDSFPVETASPEEMQAHIERLAETSLGPMVRSQWGTLLGHSLPRRIDRAITEAAGVVSWKAGGVHLETDSPSGWATSPWFQVVFELQELFDDRTELADFFAGTGLVVIPSPAWGPSEVRVQRWSTGEEIFQDLNPEARAALANQLPEERIYSSLGPAYPVGTTPLAGTLAPEIYRLTLISRKDPKNFYEIDLDNTWTTLKVIRIDSNQGIGGVMTLIPEGTLHLELARSNFTQETVPLEIRVPAFYVGIDPVDFARMRHHQKTHFAFLGEQEMTYLGPAHPELENHPKAASSDAAIGFARCHGTRLPTILELLRLREVFPETEDLPPIQDFMGGGLLEDPDPAQGEWFEDINPTNLDQVNFHGFLNRLENRGRFFRSLYTNVARGQEPRVYFRCARSAAPAEAVR
ncbi:MAG: serine/threonine protein kinase [Planctomycetota bacterium]